LPLEKSGSTASHRQTAMGRLGLFGLGLGALGVVYGDIGTSPLYAIRECFRPGHGVEANYHNIVGVLSLFFWSLTIVVCFKYLTLVMRADNHGEGGILALLALAIPSERAGRHRPFLRRLIITLGLFGASLLGSEGVITPAISVLSAVEGLGVATHALDHWVVPITLIILVGLFLVQKRGTADIGAVFGPVMLIWFLTSGSLGMYWILKHPEVLAAVNPFHALHFFSGCMAGMVFLCSVRWCCASPVRRRFMRIWGTLVRHRFVWRGI
jgi:KUP system potassium uptake protein